MLALNVYVMRGCVGIKSVGVPGYKEWPPAFLAGSRRWSSINVQISYTRPPGLLLPSLASVVDDEDEDRAKAANALKIAPVR